MRTPAAHALAAPARGARPAPLLEVRDLAFRYREREVLRGVSFTLGRGEILGLLGRNGAGKSTLFSILTGLLLPSSGELRLDGARVAPGARALRARMGVVFQAPGLDAKLSCRENLILGGALFGMSRRAAHARADELLAQTGLAERAAEAAGKLSGGMQRRLELARALAPRPPLLLMDEPTTGLDAAAFRRSWETLHALCRGEGVTVLLTTHRPDEAELCDRLLLLDAGRVVAGGTPDELRARVRGDVVLVDAAEPGPVAADVARRLGVPAAVGPHGVVHITCERGHELVPRLVEAFPAGRLRSVSLRRPTLADAFLAITGGELEQDPVEVRGA